MFKTIQSLRLLAAPAMAVLLLGAIFILEERHFDQKSALLLALVTGVAVAEILPAAALGLVFVSLVLQSLKIFPLVFLSGVLSYAAVPVVIFFAAIGWKTRSRWVAPSAAVIFAGIITVNWFTDQTWINIIFASPIYGRGLLRTLTYAFLIFGAFAALNLATWAVGVAVNNLSRSRRAQLAAETKLRETATELTVEQERNRIAGELHDVLAHSLTVIVAQADGIRFIHRTEPETVEEASKVIAESARTALVETRRLIEGFSTEVTDHPAHRVEDLVILAERLSSSGMPVTIETTGQPRDMTAGQQLTVYRLAQESLTNAFKHGDRSQGTQLHLVWTAASLELRIRSSLITSPAATPSTTPSGRGIAGMKARAAAAGGWVETVRGDETFEVMAFLPATGPDRYPESVPATAELPVLDGALL
ncbi:Signal transduction histidine kinase [Arthrobacter sp. ov407]|uniref:sensor histidine kinase n=1 Tax=Arthrobacter sp. ov407 TaxID=1761748 RepID=UPI0008914092|nr:histidine kinase [Arthrobacter sp. ov407]SDL48015.1 Signal transduction histidine kinase [Arthrobacter sp. ov407]